jgi:HisA/HisF family protein
VRLIGVVDLLNGHAVHARAGDRDRYEPVRSAGSVPIEPGDAASLAHTYVDRLGIAELYAADLDAILGRSPQDDAVRAVGAIAPLWIDAGISTAAQAHRVIELGAAHVVVGLETLTSFGALAAICDAVGGHRVAFSLDLRHGETIGAPRDVPRTEPPHRVVARAVRAGVASVIVIDLARVGMNPGPDLALIRRVREETAGAQLLAGGGIRGLDDLARLAELSCDGALLGTAILDGRIGAAEIAAARRRHGASFSP